jgi:hypothetical protein
LHLSYCGSQLATGCLPFVIRKKKVILENPIKSFFLMQLGKETNNAYYLQTKAPDALGPIASS